MKKPFFTDESNVMASENQEYLLPPVELMLVQFRG